MAYEALIFIIALLVLAKASAFAVRHSVRFAKLTGLGQLTVGFILLAVSTSLPEFMVTVFSSLKGEGLLGISTVAGSSVGDLTIIMGIMSFAGFTVSRKDKRNTEYALVLTSILALMMLVLTPLDLGFGIFAVLLFFTYMNFIVEGGVRIKNNHASLVSVEIVKSAFYAIAAIFAVVISAKLLVDSAVDISRVVGVSEAVLGATVIAFGSFIPELSLTIFAMRRRNAELALGNAAGSIITNVGLIAGIGSLINPVTPDVMTKAALAMLILGSIVVYSLLQRNRFGKKEAMLLFALYLAFIIMMLLPAAG